MTCHDEFLPLSATGKGIGRGRRTESTKNKVGGILILATLADGNQTMSVNRVVVRSEPERERERITAHILYHFWFIISSGRRERNV